jgi:hypothetical protein
MQYQNDLLDEWVGGVVLAGLLHAPQVTPEQAEEMGEDPTLIHTQLLQSYRVNYQFLGYDQIGITPRMIDVEEEQPPIFVPWGAVLRLEGILSAEDLYSAKGGA